MYNIRERQQVTFNLISPSSWNLWTSMKDQMNLRSTKTGFFPTPYRFSSEAQGQQESPSKQHKGDEGLEMSV